MSWIHDEHQLLTRVEAQIKPANVFWKGERIADEYKQIFKFERMKILIMTVLISLIVWGVQASPIVPPLHWHYDLLIFITPFVIATAFYLQYVQKIIPLHKNTSIETTTYTLTTNIACIEAIKWINKHNISVLYVEQYLLPMIERDAELRHEFSTRVLVKSIMLGLTISFPIFMASVSLNLVTVGVQYGQGDMSINSTMVTLLSIYGIVFVAVIVVSKVVLKWAHPTYSTHTYRCTICALRAWLVEQKANHS